MKKKGKKQQVADVRSISEHTRARITFIKLNNNLLLAKCKRGEQPMPFSIVVDGPNFINDLHRQGKDNDYILNRLSLARINGLIQNRLREQGLHSHPFMHTYFICSNKDRIGEFKRLERIKLLNKLRREKGVTVIEIDQSERGKGQEKEVDMSVFIQMLEVGPLARPYLDPWRCVVLIASDKDYVPAIRTLCKMGVHLVVVGFDNQEQTFPTELINESYLFLELGEIIKEMESDT